jgi:hypothetical protein
MIEARGGVTRHSVVLTDIQSFLDCQLTSLSLSLSLSLSKTKYKLLNKNLSLNHRIKEADDQLDDNEQKKFIPYTDL